MQPCGTRQLFSDLVCLVLEKHVTDRICASPTGENHPIGESVPRSLCFHVGDIGKVCFKPPMPFPGYPLPMQSSVFYQEFFHPECSPQPDPQRHRVPNKDERQKGQHVKAVGSGMNSE